MRMFTRVAVVMIVSMYGLDGDGEKSVPWLAGCWVAVLCRLGKGILGDGSERLEDWLIHIELEGLD